jgi:hypothetical protein
MKSFVNLSKLGILENFDDRNATVVQTLLIKMSPKLLMLLLTFYTGNSADLIAIKLEELSVALSDFIVYLRPVFKKIHEKRNESKQVSQGRNRDHRKSKHSTEVSMSYFEEVLLNFECSIFLYCEIIYFISLNKVEKKNKIFKHKKALEDAENLGIVYDDVKDILEFQCSCYDNVNYPSNSYSTDIRSSQTWTLHGYGTGISPPNPGVGTSLTPGFKFSNNQLASALGLTSSSYPINIPPVPISVGIGQVGVNVQPYTTSKNYTSNTSPGLKSVYKKIYYKPNNGQFGQQGAVSSSSLINRIKYDTINTAAYKTSGNIFGTNATKAYGGNIANALAYGVSDNPYTMKDKIGYPNITYPSFLKGSKVQRTCSETHITSGVKFPI